MKICAILVVVVGFVCSVMAFEKSYEGYELLHIKTDTQRHRDVILPLRQHDPELDFWYETTKYVHVFVPPEHLERVKRHLDSNGVLYEVLNDHIQSDIEESLAALKSSRSKRTTEAFDFNNFNSFDDIIAELGSLQTRCRRDLGVYCEVTTIGKTHERRDLHLFTMSRTGTDRRGIWIDATIHAREWLATTTHLKIMQQLIDNYPSDARVKKLVDKYDWYLLPVVNPDGYSYTWTTDRLWRKNRSPTVNASCFGADLNRNYNQAWGVSGSSSDPCSRFYRGPSPSSELETKAVQAEAVRLGSTLLTSIHLHTYGQLWLIPWGATHRDGSCVYAVDHDDMIKVANPTADAIERTYNTTWKRGNSCEFLYPASGLAMDYFKDIGGVKYTSAPELREGLDHGEFIAHKDQIQPSFEEFWNGLTTNVEEIERRINRAAVYSPVKPAIVVCVLLSKFAHIY